MSSLTITDAGIDVQVTRNTRAPTQQSFGTVLFLTFKAEQTGANVITKYTSMPSVAVDWDAADEAYKAATFFYGQNPKPINFWTGEAVIDMEEAVEGDLQDLLDGFLAIDSGFFCVAVDAAWRDTELLDELGAWCAANDRVFFIVSNDANCKVASNTTNIMYRFKTAGYGNGYIEYSSQPDEYPEVGAFSRLATTSYRGKKTTKTLKFKDIVGATAENIDPNQLAAIKSYNGNVFYEVAGIRMIDDGRTPVTNTWIDTVIYSYAWAEEVRVRAFGKVAGTDTKIDLTEPGMCEMKDAVEGACIQFEDNGFLAKAIDEKGEVLPAYEISSLPVFNLSPTDKASRTAPDIQFWGREAGAYHTGRITGTLIL